MAVVYSLGTNYKRIGNEINLECCPYCSSSGKGDKYTSSINLETGLFNCPRGKCGQRKNLYQLKKDFGLDMGYNRISYHRKSDTHTNIPPALPEAPPDMTDRTEYYRQCMKQLKNMTLESWRGISKNTLLQYGVGYDGEKEYFVIPITKSCYIMRAFDKFHLIPTKSGKPVKSKTKYNTLKDVYPRKILRELHAGERLYIVEGEIDALSGLEIGLKTLAILGAGNVELLTKALESELQHNPELKQVEYIIALDNDDPGKKHAPELKNALTALGYRAYIADIYGNHKDMNEVLNDENA